MHSAVAAGKVVDLAFDDARKRVEVCAHIVDDDEWKKVEQGVYTGFSPGGHYLKRWSDGAHTRYTAVPSEISIVDLPCIPSAGFTMVKAGGMEEQVAFRSLDGDRADPRRDHALSKAGRRNSHEDQTRIQTMHDTAVSLGACCGSQAGEQSDADDMGKATVASARPNEAADALATARRKLDLMKAETLRLTDENAALHKRVAKLETTPTPGGNDNRQELMKLIHKGAL